MFFPFTNMKTYSSGNVTLAKRSLVSFCKTATGGVVIVAGYYGLSDNESQSNSLYLHSDEEQGGNAAPTVRTSSVVLESGTTITRLGATGILYVFELP